MFVRGLRVYISCHVALLDRGGSIKEGPFGFRHFVCEFYKSIPFSRAIRVKRICSTVEATMQRLGDLCHHLKRRGYNDKDIESGFSKASEITSNRNDFLEYKEKFVAIGDSTCNACHHVVYTGQPSMKA
jgi:hypothetical protein